MDQIFTDILKDIQENQFCKINYFMYSKLFSTCEVEGLLISLYTDLPGYDLTYFINLSRKYQLTLELPYHIAGAVALVKKKNNLFKLFEVYDEKKFL